MIFKAEGICPNCHKKGKTTSLKKVRHHVDDISFLRDDFDYHICKNSDCNTVYFSINSQFNMKQLNKEVGYKNSSSEDALICYCYNIKKSDLDKNTLGFVQTKMDEYPCECEIRSPYHDCCQKEIRKLSKNQS